MNGQTVFSHDIRVLVCSHCGAPCNASIAGGQVTCEYCGAVSVLASRSEEPVLANAQATMSESERFQRLRAQDGKPLEPPPALQHLVSKGNLAPEREQQALQAWQAARSEMTAGGAPFPTEERFYFLSYILYGHWSAQGEDLRVRAMLETALELLGDPRYRQTIRCMLSRNAVRVGDLVAAEQWLSPCNPHSDDIHTDTQYRFSATTLATARRDFSRVLTTLGRQAGDIPIADECDAVCGVLRANAHEQLGDLQSAVQELIKATGASTAGLGSAEQIIAENAHLNLCAQSLGGARGVVGSRGGKGDLVSNIGSTMASSKGANLGLVIAGWGLLGTGILFFLITLVFAAIGVVVIVGTTQVGQGQPEATTFGVGFGVFWFIMAAIFFATGLSMGIPGWFMIRAARRSKRVWNQGIPAMAQVLQMSETGVRVNNAPQLRLMLQVTVEGMSPFTASLASAPPAAAASRIGPGTTVPVKVDPVDTTRVVIDWDRF